MNNPSQRTLDPNTSADLYRIKKRGFYTAAACEAGDDITSGQTSKSEHTEETVRARAFQLMKIADSENQAKDFLFLRNLVTIFEEEKLRFEEAKTYLFKHKGKMVLGGDREFWERVSSLVHSMEEEIIFIESQRNEAMLGGTPLRESREILENAIKKLQEFSKSLVYYSVDIKKWILWDRLYS